VEVVLVDFPHSSILITLLTEWLLLDQKPWLGAIQYADTFLMLLMMVPSQ
jgi:hypothetical protein